MQNRSLEFLLVSMCRSVPQPKMFGNPVALGPDRLSKAAKRLIFVGDMDTMKMHRGHAQLIQWINQNAKPAMVHVAAPSLRPRVIILDTADIGYFQQSNRSGIYWNDKEANLLKDICDDLKISGGWKNVEALAMVHSQQKVLKQRTGL